MITKLGEISYLTCNYRIEDYLVDQIDTSHDQTNFHFQMDCIRQFVPDLNVINEINLHLFEGINSPPDADDQENGQLLLGCKPTDLLTLKVNWFDFGCIICHLGEDHAVKVK